MAMAAKVREHIKDNFDYVGDKFADEARKMHAGETEERAIWGEATPEEAQALAEDGVPAAPLPPELAPVAAEEAELARTAGLGLSSGHHKVHRDVAAERPARPSGW